jgi:hypothetical protein
MAEKIINKVIAKGIVKRKSEEEREVSISANQRGLVLIN